MTCWSHAQSGCKPSPDCNSQEGDGEVENGLDGLPPLHGELGYTTCPVAKEVPEMIVHVPPPKD